ncbi:hypothetical protein chiPu_0021049 [Chiloscyllium punctatum]|uniref:Uncharacterized protein n=1 Tax=Chiloscyllium punctatum TaxID=137246 RepID=A0A401RMD3_CHIPU|nr:hypothetical protein [Chiloscyllium punctatum]
MPGNLQHVVVMTVFEKGDKTDCGPLVHPIDYFYDLGQMSSLDQPSVRMDLSRYSNPVPFTLQNMTTPMPQTSDFHFSLYVLLPPPEPSVRFQQPPVTVYEGNQTFYTTLPIQVRNAVCNARSSASQPNQLQTPLTSQGSAGMHCLSLEQFQQHDWRQKQHCQPHELQVLQGFQPGVTHSLSKQQKHHFVSRQYDPDTVPGPKALESGADLNATSCSDWQLQQDSKPHPTGVNEAQNSNPEVEASNGKGDGFSSIDPNEECEKKLIMLTFDDAVMMFDFELFDHPQVNGQVGEQDQTPTLHRQANGRNEDSQKTTRGKVNKETLPKEGKSSSTALADHCAGIKLTLTKRALPAVHIETPSIPCRFANDHSFYNLKPEQVNLQMLLELEDISDDESCWESLSPKGRTADGHSSLGGENPPKRQSLITRKRKHQFLDLES